MTRPEKGFGERSNDDIIREILREHASRENPIGRKEIIKHVIAMGYVKGKGFRQIRMKLRCISSWNVFLNVKEEDVLTILIKS